MSGFFDQLKAGAKSVADQVNATYNSTSQAAKQSWENFVVICPHCNTTLIAPVSSTETPIFQCGHCNTYLKTPTKQEKALFYADKAIDDAGSKVGSMLGNKQYLQLLVTVPQDKISGDKMEFVHAGKTFLVQIPPGLTPGSSFSTNIDITGLGKPSKAYIAKRAVFATAEATPVDQQGADRQQSGSTNSDTEKRAEEIFRNQV